METLAQLNALAAYKAGFRIIPLEKMSSIPPRGYTFKNGETYEISDIAAWYGNFGACIGTDHIVVDSDPRNQGGVDVLKELKEDYMKLYEAPFEVLTPRGGIHIWCKAMKGGDESYSKSLPEYPGIDFLRGENKYVVLPGSVREEGEYELSNFEAVIDFNDLLSMPNKLQGRLIRDKKIVGNIETSGDTLKHRFKSCLNLIHPDCHERDVEYPEKWNTKGYDLWMSIMAAAHYHFGPAYKEQIRRWCKRGKKYNEAKFDATWDSFKHSDDKRTAGTLFSIADYQHKAMRRIMSDYAISNEGYVKLSTGKFYTQSVFNNECAWYVPINEDGVRPMPSQYYRGHMRIVDECRFNPTKPLLYKQDKLQCYNTFKPWLLTSVPTTVNETEYVTAVRVWRRHIKHICAREPNHKELVDYLEHWIAHLLRYPGTKMKVAPMIYGEKGSGKGRFADGVSAMIGDEYVSKAGPKDVVAGWGHYYEGRLLAVFDEFVIGYKDRIEVSNKVKELITEDRVNSNLKWGSSRIIDNFCNFIFCANESSDIPIEPNERRYIAINTPPVSRIQDWHDIDAKAYFLRLSNVISKKAGYLRKYYMEDFPYDVDVASELMFRAPETEAYRNLNDDIVQSTDDYGELEEILQTWYKFSDKVCATGLAIQVYKQMKGYEVKCSSIRFTKFLRNALGYEEVSGRPRIHDKQYRVFKAKGVTDDTAAEEITKLTFNAELGGILNPGAVNDDQDFEEF